jgi:hypothetical protein
MDASIRELLELELLPHLEPREQCATCRRTLIVGEHVHVYDGERIVCDLCRTFEGESAQHQRIAHGPAFGNTIRIIDQRRR